MPTRMNRSLYLFLVFFTICQSVTAQVPEFLGYPLVKGMYRSAVLEDSLLYCGTDFGLVVWNVADPADPHFVSLFEQPSHAGTNQVKVLGEFLLYHNLLIDKADPTNLTSTPFGLTVPYQHLLISDSLITTMTGSLDRKLHVYSAADPTNLIALDSLDIPLLSTLGAYQETVWGSDADHVFRYSIGGGQLQLIDSIAIGPERLVMSVLGNDSMLIVHHAEFQWLGDPQVYFYDVSVPGSPMFVDSVSVNANHAPVGLFGQTLIANSQGFVHLYDASDWTNIVHLDSVAHDPHFWDACIQDSLLIVLRSGSGIDLHTQTGPGQYQTAITGFAGGWITQLEASSNGLVFAVSEDSIHAFDGTVVPTTPRLWSDFSLELPSGLVAVTDSFLVLSQNANGTEFTVFNTADLPNADTVLSVTQATPPIPIDLSICNGFAYHRYGNGGTMIYDISGPGPAVVAAGPIVGLVPEGCVDDILYQYNGLIDSLSFYDASSMPPTLVDQQYVPSDPYRMYVPDPDRSLAHVFSFGAGIRYSQLIVNGPGSISETTNVWTPPSGDPAQMHVQNQIGYVPASLSSTVTILDLSDPAHHRLIGTHSAITTVRDIAIVDSILYISLGGYVEAYDIGHFEPGLFLSNHSNVTATHDWNLFPNPGNGAFSIEYLPGSAQSAVTVYDLAGKQIYQEEFAVVSGVRALHSIDFLKQAGVYLVQLNNGAMVSTKRVVVE